MAQHRSHRRLGVALVIVLAAALAATAYLATYQWRLHLASSAPSSTAASPSVTSSPVPADASAPQSRAVSTPAAVLGATSAPSVPASSSAAIPAPAALAAALSGPLADKRLGARVLMRVADAATGAVLYDRSGAVTAAPASTAKLATAAAVLLARGPTARITTKVLAGPTPTTVVLVGAGDPTLSAAAAGTAPAYPDAARVSDLAAQLRQAGLAPTRVVVDGSLFSGPAVLPAWDRGDVPTSYGGAITAAMVDGARDTPTATVRSADPARSAGLALARALGLPASAVSLGSAAPGAVQLAAVQSAPIQELVGQMLGESDNVIAEVLARHVALATGQPASFAGAAVAVRAELAGIGVSIGTGLVDGSGLAAGDRISPAALVAVLDAASGASHPVLHDVLAALPVAGWSGSLSTRYPGSAAAGAVRAKTGTLTSVSALAGTVHDASGALVSFAIIADRVGPSAADTAAAETALDLVAAALAGCGC